MTPQAPTAPTNLAYTQPQSGQITLTWNASTDNVGVTGYDIYLNNALLTSVPATALTYTDTEPDTLTATYFVRAHDAAGNQSANSQQRHPDRPDRRPDRADRAVQPRRHHADLRHRQADLGASTDNVGVTGYDIYRNGTLDTSVSGTTLTYTDSQPDTATVMYYVKAHDAAGNQSQASNTVTRTGTGGTGTNLAVGRPITGTANTYIYVPANANDNDLTTYFEGSSYPSQVDRAACSATRTLDLGRGQAEPGPGLGPAHPDHRGAGPAPGRRLVRHAGRRRRTTRSTRPPATR